ncbi:MAG: hypothetical protein ACI7YS_12795 [Flavobacterium sp.]
MDELDLLKKAWKKDNQSFQQVTENEIYKMIHRKSSSIVKWILIISILELVFWSLINIFYLGENYIKNEYSKDISEYVIEINEVYNIISYSVVILFIYLFYKNYKSISATVSTKQLMSDILKTRRTVIYYVWFNIIFFVIGTLSIFYVQLNYDSKFSSLMEKINGENGSWILLKTIGLALGFVLLLALLIWLFYKLIYGILLGKLYRNYKELQKIDLES